MMCHVIIEDNLQRRMNYLLDDDDFRYRVHGEHSLPDLHDRLVDVLRSLADHDDHLCAQLDNPLVRDLTGILCALVVTLQGELTEMALLCIVRIDRTLRITFTGSVELT